MNPIPSRIKAIAAGAICIGFFVFTFWSNVERITITDKTRRAESDAQSEKVNHESRPDTDQANRFKRQQRTGESQVSARVRSILSVRDGEIGVIGIPAKELDRYFAAIEQNVIFDNSPATVSGMLSKSSVTEALEGMLERGVEIRAKVGDQTQTDFSNENFVVKIKTDEDHPEYSVIRLEIKTNGGGMLTSTTVMKGYTVLVRSKDPTTGGILMVVGAAPISYTNEQTR
jgi:hypothetical protein